MSQLITVQCISLICIEAVLWKFHIAYILKCKFLHLIRKFIVISVVLTKS